MISVGQELAGARFKKNLTIAEVAKAIKIKPQFLIALEKGEYHKLPSSAYAQGFVRNYAEFLGLPVDKTLALFRREFDEKAVFKVLPEGMATSSFPIHRTRIQQGALIIVSLLIVFLFYILFQYRFAVIPPPLEVLDPKEGEIISSQTVTIIGKTDANATLYINDEPITLSQDGLFKKTTAIFPGSVKIQVKAVNRFGRETVITRSIEVKTN